MKLFSPTSQSSFLLSLHVSCVFMYSYTCTYMSVFVFGEDRGGYQVPSLIVVHLFLRQGLSLLVQAGLSEVPHSTLSPSILGYGVEMP